MLHPKLDGMYSANLSEGPPQLPENPENCWIVMHADIGIEGEEGAETFIFYVTTPKFLSQSIAIDKYQFGRPLLIVNEFNWEIIEKAVEKLISSISGESWDEVALKINRYMQWEFEYKKLKNE